MAEAVERVKSGWWRRNWLWVAVPVAIIVAAIAALGAFAYGVYTLAAEMLRSTDGYEQAMSGVRANNRAVASLGTPIAEHGWIGGNVHITNSSGDVDLSIPVRGPNGSGVISVVGTETAGAWHYTTMSLQLDSTHEVIDLRNETP